MELGPLARPAGLLLLLAALPGSGRRPPIARRGNPDEARRSPDPGAPAPLLIPAPTPRRRP
jgi:hypothetical protein